MNDEKQKNKTKKQVVRYLFGPRESQKKIDFNECKIYRCVTKCMRVFGFSTGQRHRTRIVYVRALKRKFERFEVLSFAKLLQPM